MIAAAVINAIVLHRLGERTNDFYELHDRWRAVIYPVLACVRPEFLVDLRSQRTDNFLRKADTLSTLIIGVALFTAAAALIRIFSPGQADYLMNYGLAAITLLFIGNFVARWLIICTDRLFCGATKAQVFESTSPKAIPLQPVVIASGEKLFSNTTQFLDAKELMRYICTNWPLEDIVYPSDRVDLVSEKEIEIREQRVLCSVHRDGSLLVVESESFGESGDILIAKWTDCFECSIDGVSYTIAFTDFRATQNAQPSSHFAMKNVPPNELEATRRCLRSGASSLPTAPRSQALYPIRYD